MEEYQSITRYYTFLSDESRDLVENIVRESTNVSDLASRITDYVCKNNVPKELVIFALRVGYLAKSPTTLRRLADRYGDFPEIRAWVLWGRNVMGLHPSTQDVIDAMDAVIQNPFDEAIKVEAQVLKASIAPREAAASALDEALNLCETSPHLRPFLGDIISQRASLRYQWEEYEMGRRDAETALEMAVKSGDIILQLSALVSLGLNLDDPRQAVAVYLRVADLVNITGAESYKSTLYNNLGFNYAALGEYDNAIRSYEAAIEFNRAMGMRSHTPLMNLAVLYGAVGEPEKALEYAAEAVRAIGTEDGSHPAPYIEMARALILNGRVDEAFDYLERGGQYAIRIDSKKEQGRYYLVRGILARETGNYSEAIRVFNRGLELAESIGNLYHILQILFNLAEAELAQCADNPSEEAILRSEGALSRIEQIAREQDLPALLIQVNLLRAELSRLNGNREQARSYLTDALALCNRYDVGVLRARVEERLGALDIRESTPTIIARFRSFVRQIVVPSARRKRIHFDVYGCIVMMRDTGLEVFSSYVDSRLTSNPTLVAGLITAVSAFAQELRQDTSGSLQSIVHEDIAVLLEHGDYVTCALLCSRDASEARVLERIFLKRFERTHAERLRTYADGGVSPIDAGKMFDEIVVQRAG